LGLLALTCVLAAPIAIGAWLALSHSRHKSRRLRRAVPLLGAESLGAIVGQGLGLALFALATKAGNDGAEFIRGIVGYGTVISAPLAGVGAWTLSEAIFERSAHSMRALLLAAFIALLAVIAFFALAAAFKLDGIGWMIPYALCPIVGAVIGYSIGARGISPGNGRREE